jgi:hypothetical protein
MAESPMIAASKSSRSTPRKSNARGRKNPQRPRRHPRSRWVRRSAASRARSMAVRHARETTFPTWASASGCRSPRSNSHAMCSASNRPIPASSNPIPPTRSSPCSTNSATGHPQRGHDATRRPALPTAVGSHAARLYGALWSMNGIGTGSNSTTITANDSSRRASSSAAPRPTANWSN